eukprot:TRINITY_DN5606_c4_g1_i1.p1 TRINITY_DN5606_c4_g1~~TRINITY_DN5606_c4_g1_i1.p1  ORF type:complete len:847 (+),score=308.75 TRINITY_DN5606_c4_g1_i1:107-2647(+)
MLAGDVFGGFPNAGVCEAAVQQWAAAADVAGSISRSEAPSREHAEAALSDGTYLHKRSFDYVRAVREGALERAAASVRASADGEEATRALAELAEQVRVQDSVVAAAAAGRAKSLPFTESAPKLEPDISALLFPLGSGAGPVSAAIAATAPTAPPPDEDDDGGGDVPMPAAADLSAAAALGDCLRYLGISGLPCARRAVFAAAQRSVRSFVERCRGVFDRPQLSLLREWADDRVGPWVAAVLSEAGEAAEGQSQVTCFADTVRRHVAIDDMSHTAFVRLRAEELFDIVKEWPDAEPALADLRTALHASPGTREELILSGRQQVERRLLHAAVKTDQIILMYIATMHTVNTLFPGEHRVIDAVTAPIRVCLSQRKDGLSSFLKGLVKDRDAHSLLADHLHPELLARDPGGGGEDSESEVEEDADDVGSPTRCGTPPRAQLLSPAKAQAQSSPLIFHTCALLPAAIQSTPLRRTAALAAPAVGAASLDMEVDEPPQRIGKAVPAARQIPVKEPGKGAQNVYHWDLRRLDVLKRLVDTFGGRDAVVNHYRALLAQRLVRRGSFDCDSDLETLELLKLRFGEPSLQPCEVMLKDVADSRRVCGRIGHLPPPPQQRPSRVTVSPSARITALIQSHLYWPSAPPQPDFVPHPAVVGLRSAFYDAYRQLKAPRTLQWSGVEGRVTMRVRVDAAAEPVQISGTVVEATLLLHCCESQPAGLTAAELSRRTGLPERAVEAEMLHWIRTRWVVASAAGVYAVATRRADGPPAPADAHAQRCDGAADTADDEDVSAVRGFVETFLINHTSATAADVHAALLRFMPDYRMGQADMGRLLAAMTADQVLVRQGDQYSLR